MPAIFGSLFGHTVTQNLPVLATQQLNAASQFARVFTLARGPPAFNQFFGLTAPPNAGGVPNALMTGVCSTRHGSVYQSGHPAAVAIVTARAS